MKKTQDPAFLFYSSDFLTGTITMTDEEVGQYIRLLCMQHQIGRLSEKHMFHICKTYDSEVYSKFAKDDNGLYYNERLESESIKRKEYSLSRSKNRNKSKKDNHMNDICKTYDSHMENENEDVNIITNIEEYINYRKFEFSKYPENFISRLASDFLINAPIVYTTDKANDQYKDFVDILYKATTDSDWIMQINRDTDKSKVRNKLTEFINYCLTSQCFRTEKYINHYEFQKHFVNKYLRK